MYLLDSDTCVDVLRGQDRVTEHLERIHSTFVYISTITTFELMHGAIKSSNAASAMERLLRFIRQVNELPFDRDAANAAAHIQRNLLVRKAPIGPYDLLIAGHAVSRNLTLVTSNTREYQRVDGLTIESWRA